MKRALKLIFSLLVTLFFAWWAFRDTDWNAQVANLRSARYVWLLPYFAVLTAIHICRTLRWGCLLSGMERISFKKLNEASAIGFMMLLVLPFRLGEFARPFLIAQRSGVRRSAAMATVVLERITDGIVIAVLLRALLFFVPNESEGVRYAKIGANIMFAIFGGGLLFLLFAAWQRARAVALVRLTLGKLWPAGAEKVAAIVDTFVGAVRQLPPPLQLIGFFCYTVAYWALNGWGMTLLSRAFDCSSAVAASGCQPLTLSLFEGYVVLSVLVVGLMIPAAPGMAGTFQAGIKGGLFAVLLPASVVNSSGLAYANVLWLSQTAQQILFGLIFMSFSPISFRDLTQKLERDQLNASTSA